MLGVPGLKSQDILVLLKLVLREGMPWRFGSLAVELGMSASEVHSAIKRATASGLYDPLTRRPKRIPLKEFILFGLPYVFPAAIDIGKRSRGIPTAHSAPPLNQELVPTSQDQVVWPARNGKVEGVSLTPLYHSVPKAVAKDPRLYELLALIDALRSGRARDRALAKEHLEKRLA